MANKTEDTWRVFKILSEFVEGFERLGKIGRSISVFGSARVREGDKIYDGAREIGKEIAHAGFTVITGGGPGVMEAAARGAKDVEGSHTVGLNIKLPKEQGNAYSDLKIDFNYFFCRKVMFKKYSNGIIICPGGFGTMDEMFEVLTLIQTRKTKWTPV
ncbi:MAG: TIGR00730 family Rossman fold protein, partial [bacterium]